MHSCLSSAPLHSTPLRSPELPLNLLPANFCPPSSVAKPLNDLQLLTLPDLMRLKFGQATEMMFSIIAITSFLFLLAGNLVGAAKIIGFLFGLDTVPGIWICTFAIWAYTVAGGLFSVAYTDVVQAFIGWVGLLVGSIWIISSLPSAPGVSPAYPLGDKVAKGEGMGDPHSYDPIPNAILFNWVTIFVLGFGNLGALDFQVWGGGKGCPC